MAPRSRSAAVLQEQWRSLDSLLDSMAQRTRSYAATNAEEDDVADLAAASGAASSQEVVTLRRERDQLRRLLAASNDDLRTARAEIRTLRLRLGEARSAATAVPVPPRLRLAEWWTRWLQRLG